MRCLTEVTSIAAKVVQPISSTTKGTTLGEPLTVDMNDNGFTVHLDSFEAMAAIRVHVKETPRHSVHLAFMDSLSGKPLEGLELSLAGSTYVSDSQGMILIFRTDPVFQLAGTDEL